MRPRVPGNRRGKNPSAVAAIQQQRFHNDDASSIANSHINISAGFSGLASKILPLMPIDGAMTFQIIIFSFMTVSLLLQYLNLYRSVWWLPHSYNNNAMNFYLIDPILIAFSITILFRGVLWTFMKKMLTLTLPNNWIQAFVIVMRSILTFLVLLVLFLMSYYIVQRHPLVNILYLAYPVSLYFLLFGLAAEPFLELLPESETASSNRIKIFQDKTGVFHCSSSNMNPMPINPDIVRQEVQVLKSDFNGRLKQVLFNAMVSTYYATFVPCCFAPSALNYETAWVFRHGLCVLAGGGILYVVQIFPSSYIHMLHRTAVKLGQWTKVEGRISHAFYNQWNASTVWPSGSFVRHGKELYKAEGQHNCAEPGNSTQSRFYSFFSDPVHVLGVFLMVQSGLVLAQHLSLAWSSSWYQLISEAILLFANYYALFKLVRDYIIFWRLGSVDKEGKEQ